MDIKKLFSKCEDDELTIQINLPSEPLSRSLELGKKVEQAGFQTIDYYKDKDNAIKGILTLNENKLMAYINLHDPSIRDVRLKKLLIFIENILGKYLIQKAFRLVHK